jgi:hypothetical protein
MSIGLHTASQIALALGKTKRAVQLALAKIPRDAVIFVRGQETEAWHVLSLPCRYIRELDALAEKKGIRPDGVTTRAERLLSDPPARFVPKDSTGRPIPISDIAPRQVERAANLRRALAATIDARDTIDADPAAKQAALKAFRAVMGNCCKETWWRLCKRTIQRDAGEERFDELALYLDEVVTRKREARQIVAIAATPGERTFLNYLRAVQNPATPTAPELAVIWTAGCEYIQDQIDAGKRPEVARAKLLRLALASGVTLARTPEALHRQLRRKFDAWRNGGETVAALEDRRPLSSGWKRMPDFEAMGDLDKIAAEASAHHGGDIEPAIDRLRSISGLSPVFCSYYAENSRSGVPKTLRLALRLRIEQLEDIRRGPRRQRLNGAFVPREWGGVYAGDWTTSDDLTPDLYHWAYDHEKGKVVVMRGQVLIAADERSFFIQAAVVSSSPSYNSAQINNLHTDAFSQHGLPRKGLRWEMGFWRTALNLVGKATADPNAFCDLGLRRLGLRMSHATKASGKSAEVIIRGIQRRLMGLPGYCGRNARLEKFERVEEAKLAVEAGRADPRDHFLSLEEWQRTLQKIVEDYNNTPQRIDGAHQLGGLSPAEAWVAFQNPEDPLRKLDNSSLWLLSHNPTKASINRRMVRVKFPGELRPLTFMGPEADRRNGQMVKAWVNERRRDVLCCTDLNNRNPFVLERVHEVAALDAPGDEYAAAAAHVERSNRYAKDFYFTTKNLLSPHQFRVTLTDAKTEKLGATFTGMQRRAEEESTRRRQFATKLARQARDAALPAALVHEAPESLDYLDDYRAGMAELEKEISQENPTNDE